MKRATMPRLPSLRVHLTIGMIIAAAAVVPLAVTALAQFARIERGVETLIGRHMRQEAFGHRYLVATALARRTSRSFALLGDSAYVPRTREHIASARAFAESLRAVNADSLAEGTAVSAQLFEMTFDSLAALPSSYAANLARLRDHARVVLNAQRVEMDRLLAEAAASSLSAGDTLIHRIQASFNALDLDTLFISMPAVKAEVSVLDARLDSLSRAMTTAGESLVSEARHALQRRATDIAILVARGERNLLLLLMTTLIAAAAWVRYFPRTLDVPIGRFARVIRRAAGGDLDVEPGEVRYRELNELSHALQQLLDSIRHTDELRADKVRMHWRRLQLLAEASREFWCISDEAHRPVLMSGPLAKKVGDLDGCHLPPAGFSVLHTHQVDPMDPHAGSVMWFDEITNGT